MKKTNKSVVLNHGIKYSTYEITTDILSYGIQCKGTNALINKIVENDLVFKKDVFKDIIKLGKRFYSIIEKDKNYSLVLSDEIEELMNLDDLNDFKEIILEEEIPVSLFNNLNNYIYNSNEIKKELLCFIKTYGLPDAHETFYLELEQLLTYKQDTGISRSLKSFGVSITPFINCTILFFLIYNVQKAISEYKVNNLSFYIKPFPYLDNLYSKKHKDYSIDFGEIVMKYNFKLIQLLDIYISGKFHVNNYIKRSLSMSKIPKNTYERIEVPLSPLYITQEYMVNPIETAFEILTRYIRFKAYDITIYECDKCGEIIDSNELLCDGCKIELGQQYLNENNKKSKIDKETIKDELNYIRYTINGGEEEIEVPPRAIENVYRQRRDVKNCRNKKK